MKKLIFALLLIVVLANTRFQNNGFVVDFGHYAFGMDRTGTYFCPFTADC